MIHCRVTKAWKKSFLRKRDLHKIVRAAMSAGADLWDAEYRAKHFTHEGAVQYGYDPRSAKYDDRKRLPAPKGKGHRLPLVYSGATRTLAGIHKLKNLGTASVRRVIYAPTLNRRPKGKKTPMREEMTRVTPWERARIKAEIERALQKGLDADTVRMMEDMR